MNTDHPNFGLGYRLTSVALKLGQFTVADLQSLTGAGENTVYSFLHKLEIAGEGFLESKPVTPLRPRRGAPRKKYSLTEQGSRYLARMSFEKAAQFGNAETESPHLADPQAAQIEAAESTPIASGSFMPAVDMFEEGKELVIQAEIPGMRLRDFDVNIDGNLLTISGERYRQPGVSQHRYQLSEWGYGKFRRSFVMPPGVGPEQLYASYENGILRISIARAEEGSVPRLQQAEPSARSQGRVRSSLDQYYANEEDEGNDMKKSAG